MSRESGAVRESVLEVAMQLGLGVNPAVADWMFNNQLKEEDEVSVLFSPSQAGLCFSVLWLEALQRVSSAQVVAPANCASNGPVHRLDNALCHPYPMFSAILPHRFTFAFYRSFNRCTRVTARHSFPTCSPIFCFLVEHGKALK
jgi:hypothetical protein